MLQDHATAQHPRTPKLVESFACQHASVQPISMAAAATSELIHVTCNACSSRLACCPALCRCAAPREVAPTKTLSSCPAVALLDNSSGPLLEQTRQKRYNSMVSGSKLAPEAKARRLSLVLIFTGHEPNDALLRTACERACLDIVGGRCSRQRAMVAPGTTPAWGRGGGPQPCEQRQLSLLASTLSIHGSTRSGQP